MPMPSTILKKLEGGDPHSLFQVTAVAEEVEDNPALLADVFEGAASPDSLVKLRSMYVIEKVTQDHPEYLKPFKDRLLDGLATESHRLYRRNLTLLFPRLKLNEAERAKVTQILEQYLEDKTVTVVFSAMDALIELAGDDPERQVALLPVIERLARTGSSYTRFRARKALAKLQESLTSFD